MNPHTCRFLFVLAGFLSGCVARSVSEPAAAGSDRNAPGSPVATEAASAIETHRAGASDPRWFTEDDAAFIQRPEVSRAISFAALDRPLLSAAILQETNRRRAQRSLPPLRHDAKASEAARLQAEVMAARSFVGHENRGDRSLRTLADRILRVEARPKSAAENVAREMARQYRSGTPVYQRQAGSETVFSYRPDGPALPMHTYRSFAVALLDGWMASPGHRRNILREDAGLLGCAAAPGRDDIGMEALYCVQVFFIPR